MNAAAFMTPPVVAEMWRIATTARHTLTLWDLALGDDEAGPGRPFRTAFSGSHIAERCFRQLATIPDDEPLTICGGDQAGFIICGITGIYVARYEFSD